MHINLNLLKYKSQPASCMFNGFLTSPHVFWPTRGNAGCFNSDKTRNVFSHLKITVLFYQVTLHLNIAPNVSLIVVHLKYD